MKKGSIDFDLLICCCLQGERRRGRRSDHRLERNQHGVAVAQDQHRREGRGEDDAVRPQHGRLRRLSTHQR